MVNNKIVAEIAQQAMVLSIFRHQIKIIEDDLFIIMLMTNKILYLEIAKTLTIILLSA